MIRRTTAVVWLLVGRIAMWGLTYASVYITEDTKPIRIIDYIRKWGDDIIGTDLDQTEDDGTFGTDLKLSNTLNSVRENMSAYLQWIAGIGLTVAVMLLIYNGIILMTSPLSWDQSATIKKRMRYIIFGALAITWFYFVIRILLSIVLQLLNN